MTMIFHKMLSLCTGFGVKLSEIFQSVYGWLVAACVVVANFFAGYEVAINAVVVCVVLDTAWGIAASVKQGRFALSELGRNGMLSKWALYASVIIGFILIERMAGIDSQLTVIVICTLICLVELWSMSGSALIVNPNIPFLRLFRKALTGEIARKMGTTTEEVNRYFHEETKNLKR